MLNAKVLIVEDESLVAADLEDRLTRLGYKVAGVADNGADAIRVVREGSVDLALMDIKLIGEMDGIETAGQLREQFDLPVVFLTSHSDRRTLERAGQSQPFGYILKPFEESELLATIEIAFHRYQAEQRLRSQEEERRRLEGKMRDAQKLESLGLMAGSIAHDFNNLLTAVLGNACFLKDEVLGSPVAAQAVCQISIAARRAADLCEQMLAFVGNRSPNRVPFDLSQLVADTTELLRDSLDEKSDLRVQIAGSLPLASGDPGQIQQIALNLVLNAQEALLNARGRIEVSTGTKLVTHDLLAMAAVAGTKSSPGEHVFLEVADTGHGMTAETLTKIFDPFFTTRFPGRGLGLAAVSGMVRAHHGILTVESTVGEGSRFCLFLPTADVTSTAPQPMAPLLNTGNDWKGSGTVLLVDDDAGVRQAVRRLLERVGYTVLEAAGGREAINQCVLAKGRIELGIVDLTMPDADGDKLVAGLRSLRAKFPVLLISGYGGARVSKLLAEQSDCAFLQKPFEADDLFKMISQLLG